jgi:predicted PurR-regulated permease PerM
MNPPDNGAEKAAFLLAAAALLFVFHYGLAVSLLAGLLAHTLLHRAFHLIHGERLSTGVARIVAAAGVGLVAAAALTGIVLLILGFARGRVGALPRLFVEVARIIGEVREQLLSLGVSSARIEELVDTARLQEAVSDWLRSHAAQLSHAGGEVGKFLVHALVGAAIGFLVFFQHPRPDPQRPLAVLLAERVRRLALSFEAVVLAQVEISALNTLLTGIYLFVMLPLFDLTLPFSGTLLAVTFFAGLLPVVGNLISNTLIVAISAGVSPWAALGSLVFLVVVHKLEYFLNARIVGGRVGAGAWEMLLAMVAFEAAFGVAGVVLAPIVYAYVKGELRDRGLV